MSSGHNDPPGTGGDLAGAPSDNPAYDVPIHDAYTGLHLHRHSSLGGPGGQVDGSHIHLHDHASDGSHTHDHAGGAAVDYFDANGLPVSPDPQDDDPQDQMPTSNSGRQPASDLRRRFNVPRRSFGGGGSLSSRLAEAEEDYAAFQRERFRVEEVLADNEAQISTADVLAERADLNRVWLDLADGEQDAKSRMTRLQAEWTRSTADFDIKNTSYVDPRDRS